MELFDIISSDLVEDLAVFLQKNSSIDICIDASKFGNNQLGSNPPLICLCAFFGSKKCFEYLQIRDVNMNIVDSDERNVSHFACMGGSIEIFDILDSIGFDMSSVDKNGVGSIHYASYSGCLVLCQRLWLKGHDIKALDGFNKEPIHYAAMAKEADVIEFLHSQGCDINSIAMEWTPFTIAITNHSINVIMFLLSCNLIITNIPVPYMYPLSYATKYELEEIVDILLKSGKFDTNHQDHLGWSPLLFAAEKGHIGICENLLNHKADPNLCSRYQFSPLQAAKNRGFPTLAEILLNRGAKVRNPFNLSLISPK